MLRSSRPEFSVISSSRTQNALKALNHVLVVSRQMSYDDEPTSTLAEVLDVAEYLVRLIADTDDQSAAFRSSLVDLAKRRAEFSPAVDYFDDADLQWPW
jgi:hypothetical protein